MSPKKHSALNELEAQKTLESLTELRTSSSVKEKNVPEEFNNALDGIIIRLQLNAKAPKHSSFSSMTMGGLDAMSIVSSGLISLRDDYLELVKGTIALGQSELWSSNNFRRHLCFLENHVNRGSEAGARAWVDAFLFRAATTLLPHKHILLNMEHCVPDTSVASGSAATISGFVDYTAVASSYQLKSASLRDLKAMQEYSLFIAEAKYQKLEDNHTAQTVSEMYACAKTLNRKFIRGAVTNGRDWTFLLLMLNDDWNGATYKRSEELSIDSAHLADDDRMDVVPRPQWLHIIAAILAHWIEHSFEDMGSDDWFVFKPASDVLSTGEQTGTRVA
ncbi:hypothetical protein EV424DRAFT_1533952 [Suillus variegatus]|nr:hypothetical protein EV424DRAFT_1533952 [Suillus variegatus]